MFALVIASVLLGAIAQRITGMGFALVVSPALVLLLGPFDGVLVVNACGATSAALILARVWRDVEWKKFGLLVVPALVAIVPGAILATALPGAVLEIAIGILLILALTLSLVVSRARVTVDSTGAVLVAGFSSGFMNVTAGIGGPAISVYAVLSRWSQTSFAATLQPYFVVVSGTSLLAKLLFSGGAELALEWWMWIVIGITVVAGVALGDRVARLVPHELARRIVIVIAYLGGAIAIVHGLVDP